MRRAGIDRFARLFLFVFACIWICEIAAAAPQAEKPQEEAPPAKFWGDGPTPSPAYAKLDRKYTFAEVEVILNQLRTERRDRPQARDDIASWYSYLTSPAYTESMDVPQHIEKLGEWRKQLPQSPTPLIVMGKTQIRYAWQARGGGFANTVTDEGWKLFQERIVEAQNYLEKAIELGVKEGEAFALLIEIAKDLSLARGTAEGYLKAGMKIDPSYCEMYSAMATYLLPRWHGEPGDIETFAAEVLTKVPGDDGFDIYGHIAYQTNQFDPRMLYWGNYDRTALAKSAETMVSRYPQARNLPYFSALCTMVANDRAAALRIRPSIVAEEAVRVPTWKLAAKEFFDWTGPDFDESREPQRIWAPFFGDMGFLPSGDLWHAASYHSLTVARINLKSREVSGEIEGFGGTVRRLAFDADKNWYLGASGIPNFNGWLLWDMKRPSKPVPYQTPEPCQAVAINPKSRQIAFAAGKTVRVMDVGSISELPKIELAEVPFGLKFSADGKMLITLTTAAKVWDVATGTEKYELPTAKMDPKPAIGCEEILDFDSDGRVWATVMQIEAKPAVRSVVRFAPDGRTWDTTVENTGANRNARPHGAVLSADHRWLAYAEADAKNAGRESIVVIDVQSGKRKKRLTGHPSAIASLAFSPNGKQLASVPRTGAVIKVWDLSK